MSARRRVAVVTGTRADYGLVRPVMRAIDAHPRLELLVVATGAHLLPPARTIEEVRADAAIAAELPMQADGAVGRVHDAIALGRGVEAIARWLGEARPDVVVVLGDRIEALAAAAAASVAGVRVAHLHGGDRAEGVADEAMRHAISKLAHLHLPATATSAARLERLGEPATRVHVVGSPALDELDTMPAPDDDDWAALGAPELLVLLHPVGRDDDDEAADARRVLAAAAAAGPVLALHPNHDPGRAGIVRAIEAAGVPSRAHLPRRAFIGALRRARTLVGNSSAGLIECAALGVPCVNVGPRQRGRERPPHVVDVPDPADGARLGAAIDAARRRGHGPVAHPYGDGRTGPRVAELLASLDPASYPLAKQNAY